MHSSVDAGTKMIRQQQQQITRDPTSQCLRSRSSLALAEGETEEAGVQAGDPQSLLTSSFAKLTTQPDFLQTARAASKRSLAKRRSLDFDVESDDLARDEEQDENGQVTVDAHMAMAIALAEPNHALSEPPNSPLKSTGRHFLGHDRRKTVSRSELAEALTTPSLPCKRLKATNWGQLRVGARFSGHQKSGKSSYQVGVEVLSVSSEASTMTGLIHIHDLTPTHPVLTTFFDAEIIGPRHDFVTGQWDATREIDEQHWSRFTALSKAADANESNESSRSDRFKAPHDLSQERYLFMRWKEHCVIPPTLADTRRRLFGSSRQPGAAKQSCDTDPSRRHGPNNADGTRSNPYNRRSDEASVEMSRSISQSHSQSQCIQGASFAGFYYVCFDRKRGSIEGYYWHKSSEMFQHLTVLSDDIIHDGGRHGIMHESYELR